MTGTMILRSAEKRGKANAAFSFITWWASKDAQIKYSQAMQALQGVAGRPMVANRHAFESISGIMLTRSRKFRVHILSTVH